jgi:hypothetical protein
MRPLVAYVAAIVLLLGACSSSKHSSVPKSTTTTAHTVPSSDGVSSCIADAALRNHLAMPRPQRLTTQPIVFRDSSRIDPIAAAFQPKIPAAEAWKGQITKAGATYRVLLGYYTDRPAITTGPGQPMHPELEHVAAWLVLGHHVPVLITSPPHTVVSVPPPQCEFLNTLDALDATTGRFLGSGTL